MKDASKHKSSYRSRNNHWLIRIAAERYLSYLLTQGFVLTSYLTIEVL